MTEGRARVLVIDDASADGSADVAHMQLRISGDDVPEFRARYKETHDKAHLVGARFNAVVDPSDNLFTLRPLKRR